MLPPGYPFFTISAISVQPWQSEIYTNIYMSEERYYKDKNSNLLKETVQEK